MKPNKLVTVSRKWNNPQIYINVTSEEIELSMSLDDFIVALADEIGSVALTVRDATFRKKLNEAATRVVSGIKDESRKAV